MTTPAGVGERLAPEALLAEARAVTGLSDPGTGFERNLEVLVETYEGAARLTAHGRRSTRRRLVELLANRLLVQQAFAVHPEVRARPIRRPAYLVGLPRTGTSAFFNLLGMDPQSRPLLLWEGRHPNPIDVAPGEEDPRLAMLRAGLARARERHPEFARIHEVRADGPEECVLLLAHTMGSVQMGIEPLIPPYREYFEAQDQRPNYAYYADLLRLIDWQRPGDRWLLKSPAHLWAIDVLLEMFPDAGIIWAHRDPVECVPSYCSMVEALSNVCEPADPRALGPEVLEYLARSVERALATRDAAAGGRFVDVHYDDFTRRPIETVERVYAALGLELGGATADTMRHHVAANPKGRHGTHDYSLERYGLTAGRIRERLAAYTSRFGIAASG